MNSALPSWLAFSSPSLLVFLFSQLPLALAWFLIFRFSSLLCSILYVHGGMFGRWRGLPLDTSCLSRQTDPHHSMSRSLILTLSATYPSSPHHELHQQTLVAYHLSTEILEHTGAHRGTSRTGSSGWAALDVPLRCPFHSVGPFRTLSPLPWLTICNHLDLFHFL